MTGRLAGKVCIITGSGGSMGRQAALTFAQEGALVVGCDVDIVSGEETLRLVRAADGTMESMQPCDLSRPDVAAELIKFAVYRFGRVDVLYNNGGGVEMAWLADMTPDQWSFTLRNELDLIFMPRRRSGR